MNHLKSTDIQALRWLKADCEGDLAVHQQLVAPNAQMFGAVGATEVWDVFSEKGKVLAQKLYEFFWGKAAVWF